MYEPLCLVSFWLLASMVQRCCITAMACVYVRVRMFQTPRCTASSRGVPAGCVVWNSCLSLRYLHVLFIAVLAQGGIFELVCLVSSWLLAGTLHCCCMTVMVCVYVRVRMFQTRHYTASSSGGTSTTAAVFCDALVAPVLECLGKVRIGRTTATCI